MVQTNVDLPQEMQDKLDELAKLKGYVTRSEAVRDALRDWFEKHKDDKA